MYRLLKQEGRAKRGEFETVHGVIQTPVFMNVGTVAAIKGAVSTEDLEGIGTQVMTQSLKMATVAISTIPILVIYPWLQKYFVKGVMVGALKG